MLNVKYYKMNGNASHLPCSNLNYSCAFFIVHIMKAHTNIAEPLQSKTALQQSHYNPYVSFLNYLFVQYINISYIISKFVLYTP